MCKSCTGCKCQKEQKEVLLYQVVDYDYLDEVATLHKKFSEELVCPH